MLRARDPLPQCPLDHDLKPIVERALAAIGREYPSHIQHVMLGDADARPPRELTPAFFGAFDWHSAVHGHWCVVRGLACGIDGPLAARAVTALDRSFTPERIAGEVRYADAPERAGFERPYGLAWLLQLAAELRESASPRAYGWHDALRPLESLALRRLTEWLPRLKWPIRSGEHSQSAFALGLALDAARTAGALDAERLIVTRTLDLYGADVAAPADYEPSGHDFLSPALGEADLMRRVMEPDAFAAWLWRFLPHPASDAARRWLTPVETSDRSDGKLAHLDGLNLSRAWMLEGIASVLPGDDGRAAALREAAARHLEAGVTAAQETSYYAGTHWLGSFAMYALTRRGIPRAPGEATYGRPCIASVAAAGPGAGAAGAREPREAP